MIVHFSSFPRSRGHQFALATFCAHHSSTLVAPLPSSQRPMSPSQKVEVVGCCEVVMMNGREGASVVKMLLCGKNETSMPLHVFLDPAAA